MTHFNDPNTKFVAVQFRKQAEDGMKVYGVRFTAPIFKEEIKPYMGHKRYKDDTLFYTTDVDRPVLFDRLEKEYGYKSETIGYDNIKLLTQEELDKYLEGCTKQIEFLQNELNNN